MARPLASGATMLTAVARATARNPALASAATTRVPSRTGKLLVSAPTTCTRAKTRRKPKRAGRRGQRTARTAVSGAPTIMPIAKADVSAPAAGMETPRSWAMSGPSPESMNSDVPCAKTARASRWRAKGTTDSGTVEMGVWSRFRQAVQGRWRWRTCASAGCASAEARSSRDGPQRCAEEGHRTAAGGRSLSDSGLVTGASVRPAPGAGPADFTPPAPRPAPTPRSPPGTPARGRRRPVAATPGRSRTPPPSPPYPRGRSAGCARRSRGS